MPKLSSTQRSFSLTSLAGAVALASACLGAQAADDTFVKKAGMGGAAEVQAGKLAQAKGSSDAVKQYGAKMVEDHTKASDQLKQIADGKKTEVPAEPDAMHKKALASLDAKSGPAFDKAFKAQMVKDHKDTIALFTQESKSGKDADLKAFATATLPDLKHHLEMAQGL